MKVIDLRPAAVRRFSRTWDGGPASSPGPVARMAGRLTDRVTAQRVARRPAPPDGPRLISVGNLAVGGTGKTPVVMALARDLAGRGRSGAVLTRGFGSPLTGPLQVTRDNDRAGDEARLMAWRLADTGWPVVQARRRPDGLAWLLDRFPGLDYVLLEDAHQTPGLPRHLDILLLDRWTVQDGSGDRFLRPDTGPVFPFGPWRETARGAERAGILLVETAEDLPPLGVAGQSVGTFQRRLSLTDAAGNTLAEPGSRPVALLSGLARPVAFETAVRETFEADIRLALRLQDHSSYDERVIDKVSREMAKAGVDTVVTTLKDWVKLDGKLPGSLNVVLVDLDVEWGRAEALPQLVEERLDSAEPSAGG